MSSDPDPLLDPGQHRRRRPPVWTVLTVVVVLGIVASIVAGAVGGGRGLKGLGARLGIGGGRESTVLVESRDDLVLMMVGQEGSEEVRVLDVTSWGASDASHGARQTSHPAISPSGEWIAYFATRDEKRELSVAEVGGGSQILVSASALVSLGDHEELPEFCVCPWSDVTWSRQGRYVAFYGCSDTESVVTVKDRDTGDLFVLDSTRASNDEPRTLVWVSGTELVYVKPEAEFDTVWRINVVTQDHGQVYGP